MAAPNFNDILSKTVESVERPALPPTGHYVMNINRVPTMVEREKFDVIDVPFVGVSAGDDVDPDLLAGYGSVSSVSARRSFMFDKEDKARFDRTLFSLKTFLEKHLGIDPSLSIKEALNECVNKKCMVEIGYRPDGNDPSIMYTDVKSTSAIE